MKITIKGHPTRGKEVIQILESLGGINRLNHNGHYPNYFYYVAGDDNTIAWTCVRPQYRDVFTLEEFEKEFPFKIGDRVISIMTNLIGTITKLSENGWYYVKYDNGNLACAFGQNLKLYKEMKEERNITLTLDKAQEWYKKGGELKEIALQAFTEQELNPLPRSWKEFCENYPVKKGECIIESEDRISVSPWAINVRRLKTWIPSKKSAEAHLALIQLEQLRNCWWNGWVPDYTKTYKKFRIKKLGTEYIVDWSTGLSDFLVFQTEELAKEFLECFRDLIEKAGDLI